MANAITLPQGTSKVLDEVYRAASVTAILNSDPSELRETVNFNEFCYPQMEVGGLGNYDRNAGYTNNSGVKLEWKTVAADYDRGTRIMVDAVDNQETFDLAFGKAAAVLVREQAAPEKDAWTFAKLCAVPGITKANGTLADGEVFLKALLVANSAMTENEVPTTDRVLFVTPTLLNSVKALDTIKSREALNMFSHIQEVPQARFVSAIDLHPGGQDDLGGWVKNSGAADLNFMIVHLPAVIKQDKRVVGPSVIPPEQNPDADAYIIKYRDYGMCDAYENKVNGIYVHSKTAIV